MLRLDVRRVPVDVVVLDKWGNPVKGLTKDDFVVKEDGNVQRVTGFDAVDGSKDSYVPPKLPALPANTFVNVPDTPERGPLYILYYDMVNTSPEDQMSFRRQLYKFLEHAPEGTRMCLFVNAFGLHMLQGFTTDHELIHAAMERKGPSGWGPHAPKVFLYGDVYKKDDSGAALSNLNFISEYMSGIPGRKNLIWMSDSFPIPIAPAMSYNAGRVTASSAPAAYSTGNGGGPYVLDLAYLNQEIMKRTFAAMMQSQIALYPLSLSGVDGGRVEEPSAGDSVADMNWMEMIADVTGGRAFAGDNSPGSMLDKAVSHGETYYSLYYAPTNAKYAGEQRNIQVQLAKPRPDFKLTYRHVYYAMDENDIDKQHKKEPMQARFLKAKAEDTLYANIEHGAPMLHDLLFSSHLAAVGGPRMATAAEMMTLQDSPAFFKTRKANKPVKPLAPVKLQKYRIDYGVLDAQLRQAVNAGATPTLEFAAAAYNLDGTLLNSVLNQGMPSGNGATKTGVIFRAEQEIEAPEGAAFLRIAVRDTMTNRTGTLEVPLPLKAVEREQAKN